MYTLVKLKEIRLFEIIVVYGSYPTTCTLNKIKKKLRKIRGRHKNHILSFMDLINLESYLAVFNRNPIVDFLQFLK